MSGVAKSEAGTERNKKNNTIIILVLAFMVVVAALIGVIIYLLNRGDNYVAREDEVRREVAGSVRTVVDADSANDVMEQMREEVAEGMFECQMSMNWTFADGKAESEDAYVANSTNNTHPICFDVYVQDTEELLYTSPVLPVGTNLTNFKLDKELPAGDYQAVVMYQLLKDAESQEEISRAGFVVTIHVLN